MCDFSGEIAPLTLRYLTSAFSGQHPAMIWAELQLYWRLGRFRPSPPQLPNFSDPGSEALIAQYADAFREAKRRVTC